MNWLLDLAIFGTCVLWAIMGWQICEATHRQRGLEVDRPPTDILPIPPAPIVVPDYVPDEFADA